MANRKWLNIIVDGNSALGPHWPNIVSEYLEHIVRSFCGNSREQGANHAPSKLGLVMYNANSNLGLDVQYIDWTRDVNYFLGILSSLTFNGDNHNQHAMAKGFAEALVMFPRPSDTMTTQEYYDGERHCILVAAGDPVPWRMLVSVPEIQGRFIGTQLHTLKADFYEVAEMFGPLAVSLSIISPMQHPIFGVIFNMGNNDSPLANTPISNCRIDQFTVLLSRNFKEAHDALREKRTVDPPITESVESRKRTMDIRLPIDFANDRQEDLFSAGNMASTEKQINEAAKDNRLAQTSTAGDSNGPVQEVGGSSSPLLPYASSNSSSSSRQHVPYQMSGFDPLGRPALRPSTWVPPVPITQFNPSDFWPPPPSLTDFRDYARAWEGSLVGKIHRNRTSLHTAKALIRRATSPSLTIEWSSRLEIALYVPKKALDHTIKFCCGPIDYVFFRILQFNNLDLSDHLMSKNLCAKIHLPSQILILSPTESKYHYIGIVFPGDTIFVEPV